MGESVHVSVLRDEVVLMLNGANGGTYLDCTFGGGGHSSALLNANQSSVVYAIDRDQRAISRADATLKEFGERLHLSHGSFSSVAEMHSDVRFDGVLADLGVSTDQLHEERGFSFSDSESFDMRMDASEGETASDLINRLTVQELYRVLREGGVGEEARAVASAIVRGRPFENASGFAEALAQLPALRSKKKRVHPATVVFQALRIAVNREFEEIEELLAQAPRMIKSGGRLAVITFHSLEDRLVTSRMRAWENQGTEPAQYRGAKRERPLGKVVTRKPICPTDTEIARNPASRSAQLRVFEFL